MTTIYHKMGKPLVYDFFAHGQYKYRLREDFEYMLPKELHSLKSNSEFWTMDEHGVLTIHAGYCWDGPSGPTVDSIGTMRASLVHDVLYQALREGFMDKTRENRRLSDEEYRMLLVSGGIKTWRARAHYIGLRIGGASSAGM